MEEHDLITRDGDVLGGVAVFSGTRVPVKTLLEYLEHGESLDAFLDDFPTVTRQRARQVIGLLGRQLTEQAVP